MSQPTAPRRDHAPAQLRWRTMAAILLAALLMLAASCGSDDETSRSSETRVDVAGATAAANEAAKVPEFTLKAEKIDMSKVRGKTLFNIPVSSEIPYVVDTNEEIKRVCEEYGVNYVEFANQGKPSQWAQGVRQAIASKVDLILLQAGSDPGLMIPALEQAKRAGIPVVSSHLYGVGGRPAMPSNVEPLLAGFTAVDFAKAGEIMVDTAIAQQKSPINALIITSDDILPSKTMVDAIEARIDHWCPDCKRKVVNVPLSDWATKIRPEVQSALAADPEINWVLPLYDAMALSAVAGINAAGRSDDVRAASYNGATDFLALLQKGTPYKADVGESVNWLGRAAADQSFRVMAGMEPIADGNTQTPLRLFTEENVDETGTPPTGDKGYGDAYIHGYDELWSGP